MDNLLTSGEQLEAQQSQPQTKPNIPAKFLDAETGEIRTEALLNSYLELEKKLSQKPNMLEAQVPSQYDIKCDHGLFQADENLNEKMREKGFSEEQAQLVYDMAAEYMVPMILEMAAEFEADREVERLVDFFGGKEQWEQVSRQLLAFGQKNLPYTVLQGLASSFEGVKALYRMMQEDKPGMKADGEPANLTSEADVQSMVKDPRYWKDKDPQFIEKVTQSFEKFYANK